MSTSSTHPGDSHDVIRVSGAREHNLKDISVDIPKRRLTVFTGVSGSGKSSLVFGTIAAESQRLINETYSAFLQGMMPTLGRPEVDVLEGITTAIVVDQERMGGNARSTLGTASDVNALLRILFSRLATPAIGGPKAFSFNVASVSGQGAVKLERRDGSTKKEVRSFSITGGMCPRCEGMGHVNELDLAELFDETKSLDEGCFTIPGYNADGWNVRLYRESGLFPADKPISSFTKRQRDDFLYKEPTKLKIAGINMTYEGLVPRVQKSMLSKDPESMQPHIRAFVERAVTFSTCPDCEGTRLTAGARSAKIDGVSIADACAMPIEELAAWVRNITDPSVAPLVTALGDMLDAFVDIGLGYLTLDRPSGTLSGGESQRAKMIRHLGSSLTDVTYIFDEPSIGLHPHDIARMNRLLLQLRDKGNTVLVVEHKPETIEIADHVIDLGPGAGRFGGEVCFSGTVAELRASNTTTGRHLDDRVQLKSAFRSPTGVIEIRGADRNNLRSLDVDVPRGVLTVVTGVAGSGKSSLMHGYLAPREGVVTLDQTPIKGSRRSSPATYTGLLEPVRKAFAKANGVKPALFSQNSEGACPSCSGSGVLSVDLGVMSSATTPCEDCDARGFAPFVLEYTLGGKNIADVLAMPISEAAEFFGADDSKVPAAKTIATRLVDVGLGYISLGQPLSTLSGGERQRLKLAVAMANEGDVYLLDEPTTGLHLQDVEALLTLLDALVDSGKTVVVIEHHQAVMAHADWIIDLGPGAGTAGGELVFEGTPAKLIAESTGLTAKHLSEYLGA